MRTVVTTLLVTALVAASGCSSMNPATIAASPSSSATPVSVDVTGPWTGTMTYERPGRGEGTMVGTFQQSGDKLSGNLTVYGVTGREYTVVGFVSGNHINLSQPTIGTLIVNGNEMNGILDGWDNARVTLRRQ